MTPPAESVRAFLYEFARQLVESTQAIVFDWRASRSVERAGDPPGSHDRLLDDLDTALQASPDDDASAAAIERYVGATQDLLIDWAGQSPDRTFGPDFHALLARLDELSIELASLFTTEDPPPPPSGGVPGAEDGGADEDGTEGPGPEATAAVEPEPAATDAGGPARVPLPPGGDEGVWSRVRGVALRIFGDRLPEERQALIRGVAQQRLVMLSDIALRLQQWLEAAYGLEEDGDTPEELALPAALGTPAPQLHEAAAELQAALARLESRELELAKGLVELSDRHARDFIEDAQRATDARIRWPGLSRDRAAARAAAWRERAQFQPRLDAEIGRIHYLAEVGRFLHFVRRFADEALLAEAFVQAGRVTGALREAETSIRAVHDEAARWMDERPDAGLEEIEQQARAWASRAVGALTSASGAVGDAAASTAPAQQASEAIGRWHATIGALSERLSIAPRPSVGEEPKLEADPVVIEPRQWAADAFDLVVIEEAYDAIELFAPAFVAAGQSIGVARSVIEYNLGATADAGALHSEGEPRALARELVLGGLDRAADGLVNAAERVSARASDARLLADTALARGWKRFEMRFLADGTLEGRAVDTWADLRRGATTVSRTAADSLERGLQVAGAVMRLGRARARVGIARARTRIGADEVDATRLSETAGEVAHIDTAALDLPFVYRRLFGYRPVEDPSFLAGRTGELKAIERHVERWSEGLARPLAIVGSLGAGVSSLLNVSRLAHGDGGWHTIVLTDRPESERQWAGQLSRVVGLPGPAESLDAIREGLETAPAAPGRVVVIEQAQFLYRRGTMDFGLIHPTLSLMAATRDRVIWILSISASAWQVLVAARPNLGSLVTVMTLPPLDRASTQEAILRRHQRSGMPLVYREEGIPPRVARSVRRGGGPDQRHERMQTAVFDRIHALSDGYPALAMVYWLRSVRFDLEADAIDVHWPAAIDLGVWHSISRDAGYLMRAILEHGAISAEEGAEILGLDTDTARSLLEELAAHLIVEPRGASRPVGRTLGFRPVRPGQRYRIRPVLVRSAEQLLESRRVLY